jgi:uncharacterized protein (DUF1800 family)
MELKRREFLALSLAAAGATAASFYGLDRLAGLASTSLRSVYALQTAQAQASLDQPMSENLQVGHLLRRAGFGATPSELANYNAMGFEAAVDSLLNYENVQDNMASILPTIPLTYSAQHSSSELNVLGEWWVNRMAFTNRPLQEKMTLFWHNHFATGFSKVQNGYLMYKQNEFLRQNALGSFEQILTGITTDGAMLIWLDGNQNRKNNTNENYAREVMEVFTTGRGPYTQTDVTNAAKALTGYYIDSNGNRKFNPAQHDDSTKTFLGVTGDLGPQEIIDILVAHPATAANLSTELFQFFGYPNPSPVTINNLAQVFRNSGYSILSLVEAILKSPEFVSQRAYLANVKSPAEYVATSMHSLGAMANVSAVESTTTNQGQQLFNPPSVFGWPSGMGWISTDSMMERFNFPIYVQTKAENAASTLDPQAIFNGTDQAAAVQNLCNMLFPDGMPAEVVSLIQSSTASISDITLKTKNVVRLAMTTPFYNLN